MDFRIDDEFRDIIPPLSDEEQKQLETSILEDGVRDPLVVWVQEGKKPVLVEGHHRWAIICRHKIKDYRIIEKAFDNRDVVKVWVISNQCGRRNLPLFTLCALHLQKAEILGRQAKENQRLSEGPGRKVSRIRETFTVDQELAKSAGVGKETIYRVRYLLEHADTNTVKSLQQGNGSINDAFKTTRQRVELTLRKQYATHLFPSPFQTASK
jgi:hypothetical protein